MKTPRIGPFTEVAEFDGKITSAVDGGNTHIFLEQTEGGTIRAECSAELIARLAGQICASSIRMVGHATWERSEAGHWKLIRFQATDFRLLRTEDLVESIARLQNIWNSSAAALVDLSSNS